MLPRIHEYLTHIRTLTNEGHHDLSRSGVTIPLENRKTTSSTLVDRTALLPESALTHSTLFPANGASGACFLAMAAHAISRPGARFGVEVPGYPMFQSIAQTLRTPWQPVSRIKNGKWIPLPRLLEEAQELGVTLLCLTDPHNPTGASANIKEVAALVMQSRKQRIELLFDRVFADFAPDPHAYNELNTAPDFVARSFSKSMPVGRMRYGWLCVQTAHAMDVAAAIDVLQGQPSSPATFDHTGAHLLERWAHYAEFITAHLRQNNDLLQDFAEQHELEICSSGHLPFALIRARTDEGSRQLARAMSNARVACISGSWFEMDDRYIRLGLGGESQNLRAALASLTRELLKQGRTRPLRPPPNS